MSQNHETSKSDLNLDNKKKKTYLEILGDTILPNHLLIAVLISVGVSLGGYNIGLFLFPSIASDNMVAIHYYSAFQGVS